MDKLQLTKLDELINKANKILIIQADNPDGDSLGSAIAMEQILTEMGKDAYMYCSVDTPTYLRYIQGWSRVSKDLPSSFDLSIIVDTSSVSLLENMAGLDFAAIKSKPSVVLDHHKTEASIDFASLVINEEVVATAELIYNIAKKNGYKLNLEAKEALLIAMMSDSLGLTTPNVKPASIRVVADLVEGGISINEIEEKRRETYKKSLELTKYKGRLLERIEDYLDDQLAILVIPYAEIVKFSPLYNPPMLVMEDMRLIEGNKVVVALKTYDDGRILAKIRTQNTTPIADKLAAHFGGGGHSNASGFKTYDYSDVNVLKKEVITKVDQLLKEEKKKNEVIQYAN